MVTVLEQEVLRLDADHSFAWPRWVVTRPQTPKHPRRVKLPWDYQSYNSEYLLWRNNGK